MIKVGFSGTRSGMTKEQQEMLTMLLTNLKPEEFHHGDCLGSDAEAADIAATLKIPIYVHPPNSHKVRAFHAGPNAVIYEEKPYLERNLDIIDAVDTVIATPKEMMGGGLSNGSGIVRGSGTWHVIRHASQKNKHLIVIWPDGTTSSKC